MSFKAAIEALETTNSTAHEFFFKFQNSFNEDIGTKLLEYSTCKSMDGNWDAKVRHHEMKSRTQTKQKQSQNQNEEAPTDYSCTQSFLDLQDELLKRCATMQEAKVPDWPLMTVADVDREHTANTFIKKVNASMSELVPNLRMCDRSFFAMKVAIREMASISGYLNIYYDARESEGVRRQEYDQDENGDEDK